MKRVLLFSMTILMLLCHTAFAGAAENFLNRHQTVGVVIVGSPDFKTQNFYEYFNGQLRSETDTSYVIVTGNTPQNKWVDYWLDKGFLEEQTPKKDDLLGFVSFSGYDKVLFFIVKDPIMEKHTRSTGLFTQATQARVSLTTNAFLCTPDAVIKTYSVSKQDDSEWSDMRAKIGALKKCARDTGIEMKPYFGKI